ncbi:MAG: FAD binding domain-containing protein [Candidatus Dormibacteria bacterium]
MLVDLTEYHRPTEMARAAGLLARERPFTVPLGGATQLCGGAAVGVEAVVDLGGLGLDFIRAESDRLSIGAMTTLQDLVEDRATRSFCSGVIAACARSSATRVLRNAATVGGTLAAGVLARADLPVVLLALDARVRVLGPDGQERWLAMAECTAGLPDRGIILEVSVPSPSHSGPGAGGAEPGAPGGQPPSSGAAFMRVGRTVSDPSLVHAAATVDSVPAGGYQVWLAWGGVGWAPVRAVAVEAELRGSDLADGTVRRALERDLGPPGPPSDFRAPGTYRAAVARVLARRAIRQACALAAGAHAPRGDAG